MELDKFSQCHEYQYLIHQSDAAVIPIGDVGRHQFLILFSMKEGFSEQDDDEIPVDVDFIILRLVKRRQLGIRTEIGWHLVDELPDKEHHQLIIAIIEKIAVGKIVEDVFIVGHVVVDE